MEGPGVAAPERTRSVQAQVLGEAVQQMAVAREKVRSLVIDALVALASEQLISDAVVFDDETVLMGSGTPLDSVAFVTFITSVEDRIYAITGREISLAADLESFDSAHPFRSVAALVAHVERLLADA